MDRARGDLTEAPQATLGELLGVFLKLGLASFGGGLPGWMHQEVVERRNWLTEDQFAAGLALTQVMPGPNSVNLALFIGQKLRGGPGLVASGFGVLFPPFVVILIMAAAYGAIVNLHGVQFVLSGVAASGVGMTLVAGVRTGRRVRGLVPVGVALAVFLAIGVLQWPMVPVLLVAAPASIWAVWRSLPVEAAHG